MIMMSEILFGLFLCLAVVQAMRKHWHNSLTALLGSVIFFLLFVRLPQSHQLMVAHENIRRVQAKHPASGLEQERRHVRIDGPIGRRNVGLEVESPGCRVRDRDGRVEADLVTGLGVHGGAHLQPDGSAAIRAVDRQQTGLAADLEHLKERGRGDLGKLAVEALARACVTLGRMLQVAVAADGLPFSFDLPEGDGGRPDLDPVACLQGPFSVDGLAVDEGAVLAPQVANDESGTTANDFGVATRDVLLANGEFTVFMAADHDRRIPCESQRRERGAEQHGVLNR